MGCTHSKTPKKGSTKSKMLPARGGENSRKSAKSTQSSKEDEKVATCKEIIPPVEKRREQRAPRHKSRSEGPKKEKFVFPNNEVSPLLADPPTFTKSLENRRTDEERHRQKRREHREKGTATALKEFAKEDKEAFLADRRRAKEKRKLVYSEDYDDTLYEMPTRMPESDFSQGLFLSSESS